MSGVFCIFRPTSCVTSAAKTTFGALFQAVTNWVIDSVRWLLDAASAVLNSASEPTTVLNGAKVEFTTLLVLAPGLMMIGLLVATLQAIRHGDTAALWRVYLGVAPACVAGIFLSRPIALLILQAVDQLSASAVSDVAQRVGTVAIALNALSATTPGFGLFLLATFVVVGTMLLWCELIVRTVVLTLLLVLVPIIVPLSTFPSMRRLGWRLAETFVALAASKLIIVVTLMLGLQELTTSSPTSVITGAVTILLATMTPFVLLRVVPFIEQSAMHNLEGLRARATRAVAGAPNSPVAHAARALSPDVPLPSPPTKGEDLGLGMWPGVPESPMPPVNGTRPKAPIGTPRLRGGHVAYRRDESGPVVGWHFDE